MTRARTASPTTAAPPTVTIAGLYKAFGDNPVLRGVNLQLPAGSISAILGPSGSGKTTLLRALAGFARPDAGTITIGQTVADGPSRHLAPQSRGIGYVPQEGSLFPHLDVAANIGFGLPRPERGQRVEELLEMVGLPELGRRFPHQLSGGQQQRVALARALARRPSLVLLDEPFSSLDATMRTNVRLEVMTILRQVGTTTVAVTHDQDEALSMADQVAVLRDGVVAQTGTPEEVYTQPKDAALARFVGESNLVPGTIQAGQAQTIFGPLPLLHQPVSLADGTPVVVVVRPEQIELAADEAGPVTGVVTHRDYHGHDTVVSVETAAGLVSVRCVGSPAPAPGTTVALRASGPVTALATPAASNKPLTRLG